MESTPTDSRLDSAFRSLENQAAFTLSQADLATLDALDQHPEDANTGAGWRFQADGEPSPRWPDARYVVGEHRAGGACKTIDGGRRHRNNDRPRPDPGAPSTAQRCQVRR